MEIRVRDTGDVVQEQEFRALFPNTSLPPQLTPDLLDSLGADPVLEGQQPSGEFWQYAMRQGVEQIDGQWFTKYVLGPVFETEAERDEYIAQKTAERDAAAFEATKMTGIEFDGVMCSATSKDAAGLLQIKAAIDLLGTFSTLFEFENGNKLRITNSNFIAFMQVWVPFRQSFFPE